MFFTLYFLVGLVIVVALWVEDSNQMKLDDLVMLMVMAIVWPPLLALHIAEDHMGVKFPVIWTKKKKAK